MKKINKQPKVSIILPVHNAGKYLIDCLNSLLTQTYKNFELIIVDDHSTDKSKKILREYDAKYKSIKLIRNKKQMGVSETVKIAISHTTGDYIARMDADDIALPTRLEKQVNYLEKHKKTVAIGGQCYTIDSNNKLIGRKTFPTEFKDIYKYIFRFIPVQQPTLMIAKKRLPENFVYYVDGMNTAEEVELFFKLFTYGKVENLDEPVLLYRIHDQNTSLKNVKETFLLTLVARIKAIFRYGYKPNTSGVMYTILQTIVVLLLPQKLILALYKFFRNTPFMATPQSFTNNSPILNTYLLRK